MAEISGRSRALLPIFQAANLKGTASAQAAPLGGKSGRFAESFALNEDASPTLSLLNRLRITPVRDSGHVSHYFLVAFYEFRQRFFNWRHN